MRAVPIFEQRVPVFWRLHGESSRGIRSGQIAREPSQSPNTSWFEWCNFRVATAHIPNGRYPSLTRVPRGLLDYRLIPSPSRSTTTFALLSVLVSSPMSAQTDCMGESRARWVARR